MGFFNFLYKLSNICTNKKKLKFFIVVGFVFLLVLSLHCKGYCATSQDDETLLLYQLSLQQTFVDYMRTLWQTKPSGFDETAFRNTLARMRDYQLYVSVPTGDNLTLFWVYFYQPNNSASGNTPNMFTTLADWSIGLNSGTQIECYVGDVSTITTTRVIMSGGNRVTPIFNSTSSSVLMPAPMYMARSTAVNELLTEMNYYSKLNNSTYSTNDDELQAITSARF